MIHKLILPQAFGAHTLHGFLYEIVEKEGPKETVMERMKAFLGIPILFSIGFRTAKDLAFIASETDDFVAWAKDTLGIEPRVMFV